MNFITKEDLQKLKSRTCFLRVDLNVNEGEEGDSFRTKAILPTLKLLMEEGIKTVLATHRGRYQGEKENNPLSVQPFKGVLESRLEAEIEFIPSLDFTEIKTRIEESSADIVILENLRRHPGEQENNKKFAENLADLAGFYINDAFAVCHRENASISLLPNMIPSFGGLLLKKEVDYLNKVKEDYESPFTMVIGGAKASTKIPVIDNLWNKVDEFLIGGAVANTFLVAKGVDIGPSLYEENLVPEVKDLIGSEKIILPTDTIKDEDGAIMDIGEETVDTFSEIIEQSETIIWNGPLGYFEKEEFAGGSKAIAAAISDSSAFSVVGGGETTTLLSDMDMIDEFDFVSTGGGAMLAFLADKKMPGFKSLK